MSCCLEKEWDVGSRRTYTVNPVEVRVVAAMAPKVLASPMLRGGLRSSRTGRPWERVLNCAAKRARMASLEEPSMLECMVVELSCESRSLKEGCRRVIEEC
jgi:hypothetical protein